MSEGNSQQLHSTGERVGRRTDARHADRELIAMVCHDLRNPLTIATGQLELAREETDNERLETVARSLERMDDLIEDLRVRSKMDESGPEMTSVDLGRLARTTWQTVEADHATVTIADPPTVTADPARLQQLLENLLWNAVEHAGEDVTITVGGLDDGDGFFVADDGCGIDPSERRYVFEQGYSTAEDQTGFGLWIVETVAEDHGWAVRVARGDDGGTRFEIRGVALA